MLVPKVIVEVTISRVSRWRFAC